MLLSDGTELRVGSDPQQRDTDGDGFSDGLEFANHSNPLDPGDRPYVFGDYDGDGACDLTVYWPLAGAWFGNLFFLVIGLVLYRKALR